MKKTFTILGLVLILVMSLAIATKPQTWTDSYTNSSGLKELSEKSCPDSTSATDWTTVAWTETSPNTTVCVDQVKCRTTEDKSTYNAWSAWTATAGDVSIEGTYIDCQWNLTTSNASVSNCSVSGFSATCGGYHDPEAYGASDIPAILIDLFVAIIAIAVTVGSLIGLAYLINHLRKLRRR